MQRSHINALPGSSMRLISEETLRLIDRVIELARGVQTVDGER
jgi:hypothetical protein